MDNQGYPDTCQKTPPGRTGNKIIKGTQDREEVKKKKKIYILRSLIKDIIFKNKV